MSDPAGTYGYRRSPMLTAAFRKGQKPPNFGKRYPGEVYTADEVLRTMAACGRGPGAYRNRAMIAVMWRSGLRVSEVVALEPKDLDFELGAITVMHGKGDKRRMAPLDANTAAQIELWLNGPRARLRLGRGRPLFCTYERAIAGQPIRTAYVRDAVKRAGRRAGVEKRMHPHGLRHTFAFDLLNEGYDLVTIQTMLGHTDLRTTQRYVSHRFPLGMIRALSERAWPASAGASNGHPAALSPRTS